MADSSVEDRPRRGGGCVRIIFGFVAGVIVLGIAVYFAGDYLKQRFLNPDPQTVASASLEGLREQNRLSTFAARQVAVVTSKQSRFGFTAQKTLIMPGTVRYEVDLSKLRQQDLQWDASRNELTLRLPEIEIAGPEIDLGQIKEYGADGLSMTIAGNEKQLDAANEQAARDELLRQARAETYMKMAREATRRAVQQSFAMPLRAAGLDAHVRVLFPYEVPGDSTERWDESRRPEDVINDTRGQ
jgi:hypothetical protein